ncbi:MAG: hypothetical protein ABI720_01095, partial [Actinomycetes bacterium]
SASFTPKSQIEYEERLAAQAESGPSRRQGAVPNPAAVAAPAPGDEDSPWLLLGFLGLGAAGVLAGVSAYRARHVDGPRQVAVGLGEPSQPVNELAVSLQGSPDNTLETSGSHQSK